MYSRPCTSFAAFRLSNVNGLRFRQLMGMRMNGAIVARREGYRCR